MRDIKKYNVKSQTAKAPANGAFLDRLNITDDLTLTSKCKALHFDISQTFGDPIPELDTPELMGSVENFPVFMEAIGMASPAPMRYAEIQGESKGYYSNTDKEIVIQEGMSEKQTMKTAVHETIHAICHDRDVMEESGEKKNRMTKEVEALYLDSHNVYHFLFSP